MKYQVVTGTYLGNNDIILYCRGENDKRMDIKVIDFEPYFYVPTGETISSINILSQIPFKCKSIYEDEVDKIITRTPHNVSELRDKFSTHFEADIPFVRRMLIDTGIFSGLEVPDEKNVIQWTKLKPSDFQLHPRVVLADIETWSINNERHPKPTHSKAKVIINCVYDSKTKKYFSFVVDPNPRTEREIWHMADNHEAIIVPQENDILDLTKQYLEIVDPDIFTAWYLDFDKDYLDKRGEKNGREFLWTRTNTFDLLAAYKRLYAKGSGKLADVVKMEGLNVPNYEPFDINFWKNDLKKAILVNKSHVEAIVELDKKLHLLEFYWDLKNLVGFEDMGPTVFHGMLVENLLLRRYHNNWVLPSRPSKEEKEERKKRVEEKVGGKVLTPPFGIFDDVGVFDMSRYYPEMLIAQNLSPEPHKPDELGIYPRMMLWLIEKRLGYDRELATYTPGTDSWDLVKYRRNSVKFVTESVIGSLGSEGSRIFFLDGYNSVTTMGQRGLLYMQEVCKQIGRNNKVIYGDTDGSSITVKDLTEAKELVNVFNESLKEFCRKEKINRNLTLKLDRYFKKILFKKITERVDGKWITRGAKKRYAGRVCLANLKKNIIWTSRGKNKPVGEIQVGDKLLAFNDGEFVETEVKEIFNREIDHYLRLQIEKNRGKKGGQPAGGFENPIIVTPEHPFYVNKKWVKAQDLQVGDEILFVNKNEKQKVQFVFDEAFKKSHKEQITKHNRTHRMRSASRRNILKWMEENPEDFKSAVQKGVLGSSTPEALEKYKETRLRNNTKEKVSIMMKMKWKDPNSVYNNPVIREKTMKARHKRPSYLESLFIQLFTKERLPIKYVGDGKFWLNKTHNTKYIKRINPDFLVENQKKVIEVYGNDLRKDDTEYITERREICSQNGYECLFIKANPRNFSEEELLKKINPFLYNGVKITDIRPSRVRHINAINFHCEPYNNYFVNGVLTHNCWEDGKDVDYLLIKGFEYVRRDASPITKKIQPTIFDLMLTKETKDVEEYLKSEVLRIKNFINTKNEEEGNKWLDEIAIPVTLSKNLNAYGKEKNGEIIGVPDYVRGAKYCNEWFGTDIRGDDQVKMVFIKKMEGYPKTDVISYLSAEGIPVKVVIDTERTIERTLKMKLEDIIDLVGLSWDEIFSPHKSLFDFGK